MKFRFGLVKKSPKKGSLRTIFVQHFFSVFAKIQKFSRVKSQKTFSKKIVLREPFFGDFFWRLFLETFFGDFFWRLFLEILFQKNPGKYWIKK